MNTQGAPDEADQADEDDDRLRCTECGATTDVTAASLFESMGRTRKGKRRRDRAWLKTLASVVEQWRCNGCLDRLERDEREGVAA